METGSFVPWIFWGNIISALYTFQLILTFYQFLTLLFTCCDYWYRCKSTKWYIFMNFEVCAKMCKQIPPAILSLSLIWRFSFWFVLLGEIFLIKWFIYNQTKMSCRILFDNIFLTCLYTSQFYLLKEFMHFIMIFHHNIVLLCKLPAVLIWDLEEKEAVIYLHSFPSPFFSTFVLRIYGPSFKSLF